MCFLDTHLFPDDSDKICFNQIAFITGPVYHLNFKSCLFDRTISEEEQTREFNCQFTLYGHDRSWWCQWSHIKAVKGLKPDVTDKQSIFFRVFKPYITITIFIENTNRQYILVLPDRIMR